MGSYIVANTRSNLFLEKPYLEIDMIIAEKIPIFLYSESDLPECLAPGIHFVCSFATEAIRQRIHSVLEQNLPFGKSFERKKLFLRGQTHSSPNHDLLDKGFNLVYIDEKSSYLNGDYYIDKDFNVKGIDEDFESFVSFTKSIEAYDKRTDIFLQKFDELTKEQRGFERSLYLLFLAYPKVLHQLYSDDFNAGEFHRNLRQIDVSDVKHIDTVFWNLLHSSEYFWKAINELAKDEV